MDNVLNKIRRNVLCAVEAISWLVTVLSKSNNNFLADVDIDNDLRGLSDCNYGNDAEFIFYVRDTDKIESKDEEERQKQNYSSRGRDIIFKLNDKV